VRLAGPLHVSLLSDILQFFGPGSVPFVVGGFVYAILELGEKLASQRAKDALSKWLLTFDVKKAGALPDGTQELFERIFGERHFSLKCFVRSAAFSLGAIAFITVLLLLIYPRDFTNIKNRFFTAWLFIPGDWLLILLWLPWSILVDYVSLLKTRLILHILTVFRTGLIAIAIVGLDYIIYRLLYFFSYLVLLTISIFIYTHSFYLKPEDWLNLSFFIEAFKFQEFSVQTMSILFWAGLAPSIWMWLYVLALFVTRGLLRSERIVNWLRWSLDVEKNPFRSIGAVAATLAFVMFVAIILVSVEVSRISTGT
jgi:hypothetical protein